MNSKELKLEIVKHYQQHHLGKGYLDDPVVQVWGLGDDEKEFLSDYTPEEIARLQEGYKAAQNPKNWKRRCKEKASEFECKLYNLPKGSILRSFDLFPADDQIRAYVYTSPEDNLLVIDIQGE